MSALPGRRKARKGKKPGSARKKAARPGARVRRARRARTRETSLVEAVPVARQLSPEEFAYEGLCLPGAPEDDIARAAERFVRARLEPESAMERDEEGKGVAFDALHSTRADMCARWDRARWIVSPSATRACTEDAKGAFHVGTVRPSGQPASQGERKCWRMDEIQALARTEPWRFSPYGRATLLRYQRALSNPQHSTCRDRRDVRRACEADKRCEYVGASGWLRAVGQAARLVRQRGSEGDCLLSHDHIRALAQRCARLTADDAKGWSAPDLETARLAVEDLLSTFAHTRLFVPVASTKGVSPVAVAEARAVLERYYEQLHACVQSWTAPALCRMIQKIAPALLDEVGPGTGGVATRALEAIWFWLQTSLFYLTEEQVDEVLRAVGEAPSRTETIFTTILLNLLLLMLQPAFPGALLFVGLAWRATVALVAQLAAEDVHTDAPRKSRSSKSASRSGSRRATLRGKEVARAASYWKGFLAAAAATLLALLPVRAASTFLERLSGTPAAAAAEFAANRLPSGAVGASIKSVAGMVQGAVATVARDNAIVDLAKRALKVTADGVLPPARGSIVVQCLAVS